MNGKRGQFLSPEQSARLMTADACDRDKIIRNIVAGLRAKAKKEERRTSGVHGRR